MSRRAFYRIILYSGENGELEPVKIAQQLGLQLNTVKKYLKTLEKEELVRRIDDKRYQLTSKGLKLKKSIERLKEIKTPEPYIITNPSTGEPLQLTVRDYKQLYAVIEYGLAPRNILEEHLKRGYFLEWIKNVFNDEFLVELINEGRITTIDDLKNYLKEIIGLLTK
ncbi:regulatory protein, MarR [Staphylothermus marinus F1]|uniref:Regulatory protein, MarR n=1 Tax=Staphylothermus marinus (strain ATCC 43588 / DSM 3639 / JCM 9404 / F1) TaxID=399550 RepID=A3DPB8_STAMF|nr:winged helix-turn-helix domain-containing protein [Staphylothermus marinus]ABN70478.1 regulatory protein, MarR [Staphylothermus marinus F1]